MKEGSTPAACRPRCRGTRVDAVRNRRRILAAAKDLFAQHGADVSLDRIAHLAGISNATLYRHYEDRHTLLTAVADDIAEAAVAREAQSATSPPLEALHVFLQALLLERPAALYCLPDVAEAGTGPQARVVAATQRLLVSAQRSGHVRNDVTAEEVLAVTARLGRPLPGSTWQAADRIGPRLLRLYADALADRDRRSPSQACRADCP